MNDSGNDLDITVLRELVAPNGPYAALDVVAGTGSTNADLLTAAGRGAADRTVLIADTQTAGRGRRDRSWASPPGAGLYLSVLLRPAGVPAERLGTLGMVAGLALARLAASAGVTATLKWPNDLLIGEAKCAGVLSEAGPDGVVVVGVGVNVRALPEAVPAGPGGLAATSLAEHGAGTTDRGRLAAVWLGAFADLERVWREADGDVRRAGVLPGYLEACGTLGRRVRAELPDGAARTGRAVDVDPAGRLLIRLDDGEVCPISAGDVVQLRDADTI